MCNIIHRDHHGKRALSFANGTQASFKHNIFFFIMNVIKKRKLPLLPESIAQP
jgi:hypothetical protein